MSKSNSKSKAARAAVTAKKSQQNNLLLIGAVAILLLFAALYIVWQGQNAPASAATMPAEVSVSEAHAMFQEGTFVLDVRTQEEWDDHHIDGTTLIPLDQLASRLNELPQDQEIVIVCRSGNRSGQARDLLLSSGFGQVTSMAGGLNEWRSAGFPLVP